MLRALIFSALFGLSILFTILNRKKKIETKRKAGKETNLANGMVEYSKEISSSLGFSHFHKGLNRPMELKRKGLSDEEALRLEKAKLANEKFSKAIKESIQLKALYTEETFTKKCIRVFVDSQIDTNLIVRDDSAVYELKLDKFYDVAGEFIIINFTKKGDKIEVNYILPDN